MKVSFSRNNNIQPQKQTTAKSAVKGALFTSAVLGTSTAISWAKQPNEMQQVVLKCGGKGKYALQYAGWLALYATAGALVNVVLNKIANAINPNKPPKAN